VTIVLEPTERLRIAVLDAASGRPLRHANVLVTHGGGDLWIWGGVLPPPDAPPKDRHDVEVRPGTVTVRAASPGFVATELQLEIEGGAGDAEATLRLVPRG
jgi:hypothetical protein